MDWFDTLSRSFLDWQSMVAVLPIMITVGLKNTLILATASTLLGTLIGMVLAVMGISENRFLKIIARVYTDIFRGLPAIVTILLIGQGFARIGRDLFGPSPYPLGILALSLIAGAYIGEIFRSGIQSVERGQLDATRTLGMTYSQGMRLVVIPQAMRVIIPPLTSQYLNLTKNSSLAVAIGYPDLVQVFMGTVLNQTGQAIEVVAITMGVYLLISLVTSAIMNFYNWRLSRSLAR